MKSHRSLAAGVLGVAVLVCLGSPSRAAASVSCTFSAPDHVLAVSATDAFTRVVRSQEEVQLDDGHALVPCAGAAATIHNVEQVQITHTGRSADIVDLNGGPLAPGFGAEPEGAPEIEIQYLNPTFVDVRGTSAADRLSFGAKGINLNGDDDADVTGAFTVLLIEGAGGDDLLSPQSDYARAAPRRILLGESGDDTLIATPDGSVLHGGNGHDRLIGGPGADNLTGGRGSDVIRGGTGRDLIRAIDGTRDRVSCGAGADRAKVDGIDRVEGCERLIAIKRRGPVSKR